MLWWIFLLLCYDLWRSVNQCQANGYLLATLVDSDYDDGHISNQNINQEGYQDYFGLDERPSDEFSNANLIPGNIKRSLRYGRQQNPQLDWLDQFWSTVHKKGLSKRRLSAGEILQILRQASLHKGGGFSRGRLKGIRFGVSKRWLPTPY